VGADGSLDRLLPFRRRARPERRAARDPRTRRVACLRVRELRVSGLRVIGHEPGATLLAGLADLGVEPGVTRAELQAAIEAIPPEARARRLRPLTGATRVELGTTIDRSAGLTLHDAEGRPRIVLETPATGAPSLRFLDEDGETVLRLPR
jgi:hypothetical protein